MPGLDRSGPEGRGEMTGGGRGECMSDEPRIVQRFLRRGLGVGGGLSGAGFQRGTLGRGGHRRHGPGARGGRGWRL